jgi:hypothetical protein
MAALLRSNNALRAESRLGRQASGDSLATLGQTRQDLGWGVNVQNQSRNTPFFAVVLHFDGASSR